MGDILTLVIPIFNGEKNLPTLFQCIMKQTEKNFQVLFINDGSTDNTSEMLSRFCTNKNLRVIETKNRGVSSARNIGIKNSNSDLIMFIDSDDFIESYYVESMKKNIMSDSNIDLVVCNMRVLGKKQDKLMSVSNKKYNLNFNSIDNITRLLNNQLLNSVSNKIYRASIIEKNNILFDEKMDMGEDLNFNLKYLFYINSIKENNKVEYTYNVDNSFLTEKTRSNEFYNRKQNIVLLKKLYNKFLRTPNFSFFIVKVFYSDIVQLIKKDPVKSYAKCKKRIHKLLNEQEVKMLEPPEKMLQKLLYIPIKLKLTSLIFLISFLIYFVKKHKIIKWQGPSV